MNKRLFSGIQPSGHLHLGNYLGAIKQWVPLQDEYEAFFSVVDLHAITVPQDPAELRRKTLETAKIYLAAGIDPSKATLFVQSHVPEHTELCWILNTITRSSELDRMTQYKDKAGLSMISRRQQTLIEELNKAVDKIEEYRNKNEIKFSSNLEKAREAFELNKIQTLSTVVDRSYDDINKIREKSEIGLYDYPVLMAADILLYGTAVVPVGEDQVQHVELTRTLARRFNDRFGETFAVPEPRVMKEGARIMGLDDPTKKMSKSAASEYNYIALADDPEVAKKKIMKAVTDSGSEIAFADDKPALRNLIIVYSLLGGKTPEEIVAMYQGKGYADFKRDLADVVASFLTDFQSKLAGISDEEAMKVLRAGADRAQTVASAKMEEVREKMGFLSCD